MTALETFLATMTFVAPGHDLEFSEFHRRFLEWLPAGERWQWGNRETGRELPKHREVFRGNGNVKMISDIAFEQKYRDVPRQEVIEQFQKRVRFIDDVGFVFDEGGTWRRIEPDALRATLYIYDVYAPETYVIKATARANPSTLSGLLRGQMTFPEFIDRHYKSEPGAAVSLAAITKRFYETGDSFDWPPDRIRRHLEAAGFPVATLNLETHVGNLEGPDSFVASEIELVAEFNQLLPRDLQPDECPRGLSDATRARNRTLTRNEMSARGWGQRIRSRAEIVASMKPQE